MRPFRLAMPITALLTAVTVMGLSCTFPKIDFDEETSSSAASSTATATAATGGSTTDAAVAGSGGGGAGGAGGAGGGAGGAATSTSTSSGGPCSTDADHDGFISWECGGPDCADGDILAHPEQTKYQSAQILGIRRGGTSPFDFDCNDIEEGETVALDCAGCSSGLGFKTAVNCGAAGSLGHCVGALLCSWQAENPGKTAVQRCR